MNFVVVWVDQTKAAHDHPTKRHPNVKQLEQRFYKSEGLSNEDINTLLLMS